MLIVGWGFGSVAVLDGAINSLCMILMSNIHLNLYKKLCCCHVVIDGLRIQANKVKQTIENSRQSSRQGSRQSSRQGSRRGSRVGSPRAVGNDQKSKQQFQISNDNQEIDM